MTIIIRLLDSGSFHFNFLDFAPLKVQRIKVTTLHGKMHNMEDKIGRLEYAFKVLFPVFYCLLGGMFLLQIHDGSIYVVLYCTIGLCSQLLLIELFAMF